MKGRRRDGGVIEIKNRGMEQLGFTSTKEGKMKKKRENHVLNLDSRYTVHVRIHGLTVYAFDERALFC